MSTDVDEEAFEDLLRRMARTPDVSALRRDVGPGCELAGRFVVERKLGEGSHGRVFGVFDRERQARAALKMLGILTPRSIAALKREFRVAAELIHPNLVRLHELFSDGADWFFTMDLVEGASLHDWLKDRPGAEHLNDLFGQLALAVHDLHVFGILHGDLKPSNFVVARPDDRVVLLDFGLSRPLDATNQRHLGGTPVYMAPEQAAGAIVTEAADWYSFGVVLFEALTGSLPGIGSISQPLRERAPAAPDLAELCSDLLDQNPDRRPTGEQVLARIRLPRGERFATAMRPLTPARSRLVGRRAETALLRTAHELTIDLQPQIVLVEGDSGLGKTALLEQFVEDARERGAIVLRGRCRERESVSYKAVDGVIEDLVEFLDRAPREEATALLPDGIADLTRLFPVLRAAAAVAHAPKRKFEVPDQAVVKQHAIAAFHDLLACLRARAPLILWIDDLQWSDRDSAVLLEPLLGGPDPVPLLFIGSYRSIGGQRGATLDALFASGGRELPEPTVIPLSPLGLADAELLARTWLPENAPGTDAMAREIGRDAGGHPLFITELAHSAARAGPASEAHLPATLGELIQSRVRALPPPCRALLEVASLAAAPLSRSVARRARNLDADGVERALDFLRVNRLVRTQRIGDDDMLDVQHDRIREIVTHALSEADKRTHHRALARALEADARANPEVLATHYEAAGDRADAGRYWIAAAELAFASLAFDHAADLFQRGADLAALDEQAFRAVQVRRAEALAHAGQGAASADAYMEAAEGHSQEEALDLRRRAAEQLLLSGHLERGLGVIDQVLRALRMRPTRSGARVFWSILVGRLLVRGRGLRVGLRAPSDISGQELARIDASWTIACSLGVLDFLRGADFQNDHLLLALRSGEPRRLLRALTLEIAYSATPGVGSERRTRALLNMADELAARVADPGAFGLVAVSRGVAAYLQGRFEDALRHCEEAEHILTQRCAGAVWEKVTAQRFLVASLFQLGSLGRLCELVPPLIAQAAATGNLYASTFFRTTYGNSAWLVRDDVETSREQLARASAEWTAPGVQLPHCWLLVGMTHVALYADETERFWEDFCRQWDRLIAARLLRIGMLRVQLWHLRSMVALASARHALRSGEHDRAQALLAEARAAALKLGRERIASAAPLSELLLACLDQRRGDSERARARLSACIAMFEAQNMRLYAAAARGCLGEVSSDAGRGELIERAHVAFLSEGVSNPTAMLRVFAPSFEPQS